MTQNQISYFKAKEEQQHNRIMEAETQRSNIAREQLEKASQKISKEHYERSDTQSAIANELRGQELGATYAKLDETRRSNLANEGIARTRATADAYLNYSVAGLRQAETALTDLKAENAIAEKHLTEAQEQLAYANYYNTLANVSYTHARTENVLMNTNMMPLNTASNMISSLGKLGPH